MEQVDPKLRAGFDSLVKDTRDEAINIIKVEIPKKILMLNDLSKDIISTLDQTEEDVDVFAPVVPSNEKICEQLEKIKTELWDMINYIITVKFYIMLNQPKKEDGNTFGVEVQNEIVGDLSAALESSRHLLSDIIQYFVTRASFVTNCRANPHISDYKNGIICYDNKEILVLSQSVVDIRNTYAVLYDKIMKNYDKIVKPCGTHTGIKWDALY